MISMLVLKLPIGIEALTSPMSQIQYTIGKHLVDLVDTASINMMNGQMVHAIELSSSANS